MQVSSAEQEVSCSGSSPQGHCDMVRQLLSDPSLTDNDRIRLLLLYALRYERDGRSQARMPHTDPEAYNYIPGLVYTSCETSFHILLHGPCESSIITFLWQGLDIIAFLKYAESSFL